MNSSQLAARMGISQAAAAKMERSEIEQAISLKTLSRAAEALDCDLVYALVPKTSLVQTVLDQAQSKIVARAERIFRSMGLELQSTTQEERDQLLNELVEELIKQGGRELWT
jgi:predicted DNA-binding mobile mystery protein A